MVLHFPAAFLCTAVQETDAIIACVNEPLEPNGLLRKIDSCGFFIYQVKRHILFSTCVVISIGYILKNTALTILFLVLIER